MKTKLALFCALLIAGIARAQTVTITDAGPFEFDNVTFTNTNAGQPCVNVATALGVLFQNCTFNSPGSGIVSSVNGTIITLLGYTATNTAQSGQTPGPFLELTNVSSLVCNDGTLTGWASLATINGVGTNSLEAQPNITISGNSISNSAGPIALNGLDLLANTILQFYSNSFTGVPNPSNLMEIDNLYTHGSTEQVYFYSNTVTGTWHGFALEAEGKFQFVNFAGTGNAKFSWVGLQYGPPSAAGQ